MWCTGYFIIDYTIQSLHFVTKIKHANLRFSIKPNNIINYADNIHKFGEGCFVVKHIMYKTLINLKKNYI